jgi:hypothetical protein
MAEKTNPVPGGAPAPKSRFFTPYVLIWAVLASGSLLYLALLATEPQLVASFLGAGPAKQTSEVNAEKQAMIEAVAEVRLLRESVDRFRDDLQELRAEVSNQNERGGDMTARISALETAAAAAQADPLKVAADKRAAAKAAKAEATAALQQAAPKAAAVAAKKPEAALETGSVAGPPVSFGPAIVTPAQKVAANAPVAPPQLSKTFGVQIASGPSVDSLRLSWTLLAERHGDSLRSLQPRYTMGSDGTGTTYDLVAGPLKSAAEATRLCQELSAQATPCSIGVYSGDVL